MHENMLYYYHNYMYRKNLCYDILGQFPCTVCGKVNSFLLGSQIEPKFQIFCHSSSLSRHRMQAHFKASSDIIKFSDS